MNFGIVVAAGKSERMGAGIDKAFLNLGSKPVLAFSLLAFENCPEIEGVILVAGADMRHALRVAQHLDRCGKPGDAQRAFGRRQRRAQRLGRQATNSTFQNIG